MTTAYERIADHIERDIRSGALAPGDVVPSTRRIVAEHGVAMATATRALAELQRRGVVAARRGVGTVVVHDDAARRAPGTRRAGQVTTADVVHAAVRLADAEGLGGLSMRRIAADVGLPTMSVYRHVTGRDDLLNRMLDVVYGRFPLPATPPGAGWRAVAETCARTLWAMFVAHPWAAHAVSMTRPQAVPNGVAITEVLLGAFDVEGRDGRPLDVGTRMHLVVGMFQLVRGVGVSLEPAEQARQDSGLTDDEWIERTMPALHDVADARRHPHLARAVRTEIDLTLDSLLEFSLARLLDGYEAFLGPGDAAGPRTGG